MNTWMKNLFFLAARAARLHFRYQTRRTTQVQRQFLNHFIRDFRKTAFGRDLGLDRVTDLDAFRAKIPVIPYSQYEPYLERVQNGEQGVLTPDPVTYLTVSSGTTGRRKLIPVTPRSSAIRNRARRASTGFFGHAMQRAGRPIGPILLTNAALLIGQTAAGIPYGTASAGDLVLNRRSYRGRGLFAYPFEAFEIADNPTRNYICLLFSLARSDTGVITGNFPPHVLHLASLMDQFRESLIADIEHGQIAADLVLPARQRTLLARAWKADPERARSLRKIVAETGSLRPKDAWPNLSLVTTARGAPSYFYFRKFPHYFGQVPIFGGIYGSSEAIYGVYHSFDSDHAVLAINTGFFEFVPRGEWDKPFPNTLLPSEVQPGEHYRILSTNYAGLYRYDIGDIVKVLDFWEGAPCITFIRRKGSPISSFSEKTTETHIARTIEALQKEFNLQIEDYCVSLSDEIPARYILNIEPVEGSQLPQPQAIIRSFDHYLQSIHDRYKARRANAIPPPLLRIMGPGSFQTLRTRNTATPGADTNTKTHHTTENRNYLSGLPIALEIKCE